MVAPAGSANHPGRGKDLEVRYAYAPGCFRAPGPGPRDEAVLEVARALDLTFEEVEEAGASPTGALALDGIPAYVRVGRVLTFASLRLGGGSPPGVAPTLVSPCTACFRNLSRARHALRTHPELHRRVTEELAAEGLPFEPGSVRVRHLLEVLHDDVGPSSIRARVTRPLSGLRVVPYYGCLGTRPAEPGETAAEPGSGRKLEEVLSSLGADVVDFPLRDHCCGGRASRASEETATSLLHRILRGAADARAAVIAVVCPRCRYNVRTGQQPVNRRFGTRFALPVRHFAELAAEAFGIDVGPATRAEVGVRS